MGAEFPSLRPPSHAFHSGRCVTTLLGLTPPGWARIAAFPAPGAEGVLSCGWPWGGLWGDAVTVPGLAVTQLLVT